MNSTNAKINSYDFSSQLHCSLSNSGYIIDNIKSFYMVAVN